MRNKKLFQNIASSILSSHVTAFYLDKLKGTPYAKGLLKKYLNMTLKEMKSTKHMRSMYFTTKKTSLQLT